MKNKTVNMVFCLHGLGNSKYLMTPLCLYLQSRGFRVVNLPYPSTKGKIEQFSELVKFRIQKEAESFSDYKIHLLGFSLGSQIFIDLLTDQSLNLPVQNFLMLGPPNKGADFAKWLKTFLPTEKIWGPVYNQLCEARGTCSFGQTKVGIIAGGTGFKYGFNPFLSGDNDGIVKVSETHFSDEIQHRRSFCLHALMPLSPAIWKMADNFFKQGVL